MAWWKTLFDNKEEVTAPTHALPALRRGRAVSVSSHVAAVAVGGLPPVNWDMVQELIKLSHALNLHTADDVREVFGEIYNSGGKKEK